MIEQFQNGRRLELLLRLPALTAGVLTAICAIQLIAGKTNVWLLLIVSVLFLALGIWLFKNSQEILLKDLLAYSANHSRAQEVNCLREELPYAIISRDGTLLWQNDNCRAITGTAQKLTEVFPELEQEHYLAMSPDEELYVQSQENTFRLSIHKLHPDDVSAEDNTIAELERTSLYGVFFYDETERIYCEEEMEQEKMVVGLIYLDNYEEALAATDEVHRSVMLALIDRKINKFFENMDAIVRKTEKDRYFVVIKQKYIPMLKDTRFALLEDVKSSNFGQEMSVTLSIGMGMNGGDYTKNFEYARMAMDMALGRGGDQAVVKDGDRIQYFGGKSLSTEKTTRVKARVKAHALCELVENKENVMVMGHKLGDVDCFGAAIGIYRAMTTLGKKTQIVINDVTNSVKPFMDEFTTGEYPDDMFLSGDEAVKQIRDDTVLVVVDVNRISITEEERLLSLAKTIVVLDHHRQATEVIQDAVLSYVEPYASSACELVAEVLQYISDSLKLRPAEANVLYAGIVLDTNNFTTQTGVRTFEAAAYLRRNGADVVKVRKLFRDNMEDYMAKAAAVHNAEVFCGSFAISVCPAEGSENPTIVGAQAANELLNIVGIKASIVLTEYNDKIYVSARSIDEVNVQLIMERLGGGGHLSTAGAQLVGCSIGDAVELVKETVKQMLEEGSL